MTDIEYLKWLYERLIHVYHESPHVDFVQRLGEMISKMEDIELAVKQWLHEPTD